MRLKHIHEAIGQRISGFIDVEDAAIRLEVVLPSLLGLMANKVRSRLRREGQLLLDKK